MNSPNVNSPNAVRLDGQTYIYEKGDDGWRAIEFGTGKVVPISPALLQLITEDHEHQLRKRAPQHVEDEHST